MCSQTTSLGGTVKELKGIVKELKCYTKRLSYSTDPKAYSYSLNQYRTFNNNPALMQILWAKSMHGSYGQMNCRSCFTYVMGVCVRCFTIE